MVDIEFHTQTNVSGIVLLNRQSLCWCFMIQVMKAINTNSARALRKAISIAPRAKRASELLNITVGTQSISPFYWAIDSGSLECAKAMIEDLLTIRADRSSSVEVPSEQRLANRIPCVHSIYTLYRYAEYRICIFFAEFSPEGQV